MAVASLVDPLITPVRRECFEGRDHQVKEDREMCVKITIACCCCKKKVCLGEIQSGSVAELVGWVSIDRKPLCDACLALFTQEDWDWCTTPPVPLGWAEIEKLIPGDVEPL